VLSGFRHRGAPVRARLGVRLGAPASFSSLFTGVRRRISMKMSSRRAGLEGGSVTQHRPQYVDPPTRQSDESLSILAEVERPYSIFGGAVSLCQSCVLAHVLRQGFDQGVAPGGSFQPPEVLHELGKTHNVSFRPGSRHFYRRLRWGRRI
jgi:hypothetical protein